MFPPPPPPYDFLVVYFWDITLCVHLSDSVRFSVSGTPEAAKRVSQKETMLEIYR